MKITIYPILLLIFMIFFMNIGSTTAYCELIIIVNKNVNLETIAPSTVSNIYFGKKTKWPDGQAIHVVMLKKGKTHETFVNEILQSTPSRLKSYWKKVVFTGVGLRPRIFREANDLITYIAQTKNTIGYIDDSVSHEHVKVLELKQ